MGYPIYMQAMAKRTKRAQAQRAAEQSYEGRGKRPGTPVSARLSDVELELFDAERGDAPRAAFLLALIRERLRINQPAAAKRRKKPE